MRKLLVMFGIISTFVISVYACENEVDDKVIFTVGLHDCDAPRLIYLGSKRIDAIKKYFPDVEKNEPFCTVKGYTSKTIKARCYIHDGCTLDTDKIPQMCAFLESNLKHIPLRYFLSDKKKFKSEIEELCVAECMQDMVEPYLSNVPLSHKYKAALYLDSSKLSSYSVENVINCFRNKANWPLEGEDKEELLKAQIINEEDGHGINSYFSEEIKAALFYARLKTIAYLSLAAIVVYVLYKKLYTTS
ncbi:MAG TPA: hypothetical protein VKU36_01730 [Candidatus Babeliales bacterium]|nr:hypothetical protein [Candidatus Babeliales bacterium]